MKIQLEETTVDPNRSFSVMVNPKMSDFYFWHFHPAIELVYIVGANGTRQVGDHISKYSGSDLVLIGSNIPHLNFDFGVKTEYEKRVIHFKINFLDVAITQIAELKPIGELFEKAKHGIAFGENIKQNLHEMVMNFHFQDHFSQFTTIITLLNTLANTDDFTFLHEKPFENMPNRKQHQRMNQLYQFLDENYLRKIEIDEVANLCSLSNAAFCRFFKQMTKLTFIEFLNHYRINYSKNLLLSGKNVSESCFESGFESLSYFNRTFRKITGQNPLAFKNQFSS